MTKTDYQLFINDVKLAIEQIRKEFQENPFIFLNESDIQCYLYHILAKKYCKAKKAGITGEYTIKQNKWKMNKKVYPQIKTFSLHSEIPHGERAFNKRVDLIYSPLNKYKFKIVKTKFGSKNKTAINRWQFDDGVGVEIKYNFKVQSQKNISKKEEYNNFKELKNSLKWDIGKLHYWDYGIFLFVDMYNLFTQKYFENLKRNDKNVSIYYLSENQFFKV